MLAVSGQAEVWLGGQPRQRNTVRAAWPTDGWPRHSAGAGAQGPRGSAGSGLPLAPPLQPPGRRGLWGRRRRRAPTALTACVVCAPPAIPVAEAVQGAGTRWTIERRGEAAQGAGGVAHDEGRSWTGWERHITWALWAYAVLTVVRARPLQEFPWPKKW